MKFERLLSILMLLANHQRFSAPQLAEKFEVSVRTIYRDIDSLCVAGFPIQTETGVNGGFTLMKEFKMNRQFFSVTDIEVLWRALENSPIDYTKLVPNLFFTIEKLQSLLPENEKSRLKNRVEQIVIDTTPWTNTGFVQPHTEKIYLALRETKRLKFCYVDRKGAKHSRVVEPYQLVLKETSWYLQGFCLVRQAFRIFKVSRMSDLEVQSEVFIKRDFKPKVLGKGHWEGEGLSLIQLRFHESIKGQLVEKFAIKNLKKTEEEWYQADFPFMEDEFGYQLLLSFGGKGECIGPAKVRNEVKHRIEELRNRYQ